MTPHRPRQHARYVVTQKGQDYIAAGAAIYATDHECNRVFYALTDKAHAELSYPNSRVRYVKKAQTEETNA